MIDPQNGKSVWLFENLLSYLGNKIIFSWDDLERSYFITIYMIQCLYCT